MDRNTLQVYLMGFLQDTVFLVGIPLAAATLVGLTVSFFQAITQVQDQTLSQTLKIAAIVFVLAIYGSTLISPLMTRTEMLFSQFGTF